MTEVELLKVITSLAARKAKRKTDDQVSCSTTVDARQALGQLLEQHYGWLYRFCLANLGDPSRANDCVQEIMVEVARSIGQFRGRSALKTWIFVIARRALSKAQRREQQRREKLAFFSEHDDSASSSEIQAQSESISPEQKLIWSEKTQSLLLLISELPEKQKNALLLHYFEDLSVEDAARQMGCSISSLKTHLARGRKKLKKLLEHSEVTHRVP